MKAMVLTRIGEALQLIDRPTPDPGPGQVLVKITACGVCRTDLHLVDGELENPALPIIPGHEIVGRVAALGAGVSKFRIGERVGISWLGRTCGSCPYCTTGRENLCDEARFNGYTLDGGYADYTIASADYCFPLLTALPDVEAAPLLCAGTHRLSMFALCGRRKAAGDLRFRRSRAYRRSGRNTAGPRDIRLHPAG